MGTGDTLSTEVLKPIGLVEMPVLNGSVGSPLTVSVLASPGFTGFPGCVFEDSWAVREDIVDVGVYRNTVLYGSWKWYECNR